MLLQIVSYVGVVFGFLFLVISIASGLYYISELIEEHTEVTRRFLRRTIYSIAVLLALLWLIDGLSLKLTIFSIFSYWVYLQNLHKFPYVDAKSPVFVASCVLAIANHWLWFQYFHNPYIPPIKVRLTPGYVPPRIPSFIEVCSFFGICIWFVPFSLFVSLSANDNVLPHHADPDSKKPAGLAKVVVSKLREFLYSVSRQLGYELDPSNGILA